MIILNPKGDTIVEVMIAIVVIGAALGSALAISNRSSQQTQANHERYQAQLKANEQAELLRQDYAQAISTGTTRSSYNPTPASGVCTTPCLDIDPPQNYDITVSPVAGGKLGSIQEKTYRITVMWDSLVNDNQDKVEIIYGL